MKLKIFLLLALFTTSTLNFAAHYWDKEIEKFEQLDRNTPAPYKPTLFIGSSSIRLWKSLRYDFPNQRILNRGFGGSQVYDLIYYYNRIIKKYRPSKIVIYSGENDLDFGKSPSTVSYDYQTLIHLIKSDSKDVPIFIFSIKLSPRRIYLKNKIEKTNNLIERLTNNYSNVFFVNTYHRFFHKNGRLDFSLYASDHIHLNSNGYRIFTENLLKVME